MAGKPTYEELEQRIKALEAEEHRRRAVFEHRVQRSGKFLGTVLNRISNPICIKDENHYWVFVNDRFCEIVGAGREELMGKSDYDFFPEKEADVSWDMDENVLLTGEENSSEGSLTNSLTGERFFLNIKKSLYENEYGEKFVVAIGRDFTQSMNLQAETMHAGHLAALGELAAGVAHELNNPITGIISLSELLKSRCNKRGEDDEIPTRIISDAVRAAGIVKNLLSFARERTTEYGSVQVEEILLKTFALAERQLVKDGIKTTLDFPPELPKVRARGQEIQQVFLNILSNARYTLNRKFPGIHEDKSLEIRGETVEINGRRYVRTTFYDKGTGISPDILDRICEPFFSTKPEGEGTGLGLSISHGIIKRHGGRLWFESVEGEYAKTVVELPVGE